MEHGRQFYVEVIKVIDYLNDGHKRLVDKDGLKIAPLYWPSICNLLKSNNSVYKNTSGFIQLNYPQNLTPLLEDAKSHIVAIDKAEEDRKLANKEKEENILYGRKGYRLSKIALWVSIASILANILMWIIRL